MCIRDRTYRVFPCRTSDKVVEPGAVALDVEVAKVRGRARNRRKMLAEQLRGHLLTDRAPK